SHGSSPLHSRPAVGGTVCPGAQAGRGGGRMIAERGESLITPSATTAEPACRRMTGPLSRAGRPNARGGRAGEAPPWLRTSPAACSTFLRRLSAAPLKTQRINEGVRLVARRDPFDQQLARRLVARAEDDAGQRHVAYADQFQHRGDAVGAGGRLHVSGQPLNTAEV